MSHRPDTGYVQGEIELPRGYKILSWQEQEGMLCMWAEVCPDMEKTTYKYCLHSTGYDTSHLQGAYWTTVLMHGGKSVIHIFGDF